MLVAACEVFCPQAEPKLSAPSCPRQRLQMASMEQSFTRLWGGGRGGKEEGDRGGKERGEGEGREREGREGGKGERGRGRGGKTRVSHILLPYTQAYIHMYVRTVTQKAHTYVLLRISTSYQQQLENRFDELLETQCIVSSMTHRVS